MQWYTSPEYRRRATRRAQRWLRNQGPKCNWRAPRHIAEVLGRMMPRQVREALPQRHL